MRKSLFIFVVCFISCPTARAEHPGSCDNQRAATPYDTDWFTDADQLLETVSVADTPNPSDINKAFCSRSFKEISNFNSGDPVPSNRMGFTNPGGWFGTGLCWFHNRFNRAAVYLANYRPNDPPPTEEQAEVIANQLISMNRVVTIPGSKNLSDFTSKYRKQIEKVLNKWSLECVFSGDCIRRIGDVSSESANDLQKRMDGLYHRMLEDRQILFLRYRPEGKSSVYSHSILLLNIEPIRAEAVKENPLSGLRVVGYKLTYYDSNDYMVWETKYQYGDTTFGASGLDGNGSRFIPYVDYDEDLVSIRNSINKFCSQKKNK